MYGPDADTGKYLQNIHKQMNIHVNTQENTGRVYIKCKHKLPLGNKH